MTEDYQRMFWGLLEYKPGWSLTLKAWLIIITAITAFAAFLIRGAPAFLAVQRPVEADALLIEGWTGDPVIEAGVREFSGGKYKYIITTGVNIYRGSFLLPYKTYADSARALVISLGVEPDRVIAVPTPRVSRDRTAASAIEVKERLLKDHPEIKSLNIYSFDVHTRRSYLIYRKVLGPDFAVGAIAHPNADYDPRRWWASSMGFRYITEESLAYIYARLVWYPRAKY